MRYSLAVASCMVLCATRATAAQDVDDGPVLRARHASARLQVKVINLAGAVRLVGWDKDSIVVRGRIARSDDFYFGGRDSVIKFGIDERSDGRPLGLSDLVVYLPRHAQTSLKTVDGDITGSNVSGWFYTVAGNVRLGGSASTIEVQSMSGNVDLNVVTPWIHARTGDGNLLVRGEPQDVDASTIGGTLSIASSAILRGQFGSVAGNIQYAGAPAASAIFDFSNHSGAIEFLLPRSVSGVFSLSSITGPIENGFTQVRPVAATPRSIRLSLGNGGAQISARTFKGAIRLRPQ